MSCKNIELLAPVGSYESLTAAIQAGADSIYFGVEQLNMRARSSVNFTIGDLATISTICKTHSIKCYLTLNTVLYDHDLQLMRSIINNAKEHKIDAIIASDHAVFNYAKKIGVPVHISTQSNVSNIESVEFYSEFADAIVLARELSLLQVEEITREIKKRNIIGPSGNLVKIEIFVHGALCMAISGKCYMSLHSDVASANRGACIQNCRKSYLVKDKESDVEYEIENEYIMSAKDLCTIEFIDQILRANVSILKIEGRGRSADYVHEVVSCYKEAVNAYLFGNYNSSLFSDWKNRLNRVYNRGFWEGYYLGKTMGEWSSEHGSIATKRKVYVAKGIKYYSKAKIGEFISESHSLKIGDEILIIGPTTGIIKSKVSSLMVNGLITQRVSRGNHFSIPIEHKIRSSDKLYKIIDSK